LNSSTKFKVAGQAKLVFPKTEVLEQPHFVKSKRKTTDIYGIPQYGIDALRA
jgi:hypothetical protein